MIRTSTSNRHRRRARGRERGGFTLVELLVVIIVLAILVGLLLPVIAGALRTAKNAAAQAEINQLAQALANFKAKYGDYPPSRVYSGRERVFSGRDRQRTSTATRMTSRSAQLAQRSLIALRKFFPKVVFSTSGQPPQISYNADRSWFWYDFNGNGEMDGALHPPGRRMPGLLPGGHSAPGSGDRARSA